MPHLPQHILPIQVVEPIVSISKRQKTWIVQVVLGLHSIPKHFFALGILPRWYCPLLCLTPPEIIIDLPFFKV